MMANTGQSEASPSAKQLVFLAMMATVVAVIVFLCGVLVGRGVPVGRSSGPAVTDTAPSGAGAIGLGVPERAADPEAEPGSPLDDLSYFGRLTRPDPAPETLDAPADGLAAASAPEPDAAPSVPGVSVGAETPNAARAERLAGTNAPAVPSSFVVQVTALRNGDEARTVATGLEAKGYPAFVVDPTPGAPAAVYRVRVGPYADQAEAETVRHRLEIEEQFKPWVIQP